MRKKISRLSAFLCAIVMVMVSVLSGFSMKAVKADDTTDYTDVNLMQYATLSSTTVVYGELERLRDGDKTYYRAGADSESLPAAGQGVVVAYDETSKLAYYQADFDRELPLGRVTLCLSIHETEKRARDIVVDVKLADGTWQRVAEKHNISDTGLPTQALSSNGSIAAIIPMNFATVECIGFRVTANGQRTLDNYGAIGNFRLVEIEAYNQYPSAGQPTGTTEDSNSAYNIPHIEPDYTGINLMQYATVSSTTVLANSLSILTDTRKTYYKLPTDTDTTVPAAGAGVAVGYDSTSKLAYYQAEFGREVPLGQIKLFLSSDASVTAERPQDIAVDVKLTDGTWKRVAEMHDVEYKDGVWKIQTISTAGSIAVYLPMNFDSVECVGFRVTANGQRTLDEQGNIGNFRLVEMEAYSEYPSTQLVTGTTEDSNSAYNIPHIEPDYTGINLMQYATVSSTTVLANSLSILTDMRKTYYKLPTDTDTTVPAAGAGVAVGYDSTSKLAYYQADFDREVPLGQIQLFLSSDASVTAERPQDIAVDVKLADGTWKRVAEMHDVEYKDGVWKIQSISTAGSIAVYLPMNFDSVECVGFRVTANGQRTLDEQGNIGNFRLVEMEAYSEYPATQLVTGTAEDGNSAYNIPHIEENTAPAPDDKDDEDDTDDTDDTNENLMKYATTSSSAVLAGTLTSLTDEKKTYHAGTNTTVPPVGSGVAVGYDSESKLAYYQADFDREVSLGQVRLYLYVAVADERPQDIAVDVKLADGTWVRVAERHDITYENGVWSIESIGEGGAIAVYLGMNFESVECTAFRVTANGQRTLDEIGNIGNFRLVEIEAYSTYSEGQSVTGVTADSEEKYNIPYATDSKPGAGGQDNSDANLMKYATISSTTVLQNKLSILTDGAKTWSTGTNTTVPKVGSGVAVAYDGLGGLAYYQADFSKAVLLGQVRLYLYVDVADERPQDIAVDVKLTDGTWKRVAERHDIEYQNGVWNIETIGEGGAIAVYLGMNFESVECTAFRVSANGQRTKDENGKFGNFRLVELEAYSEYPSSQSATGIAQETKEEYNIPHIGSNGKAIIYIDYAAFGLTEDWQTTLLSKKINYDGVVGGSRESSSAPDTSDKVVVLGVLTGIMLSTLMTCGYISLKRKKISVSRY